MLMLHTAQAIERGIPTASHLFVCLSVCPSVSLSVRDVEVS